MSETRQRRIVSLILVLLLLGIPTTAVRAQTPGDLATFEARLEAMRREHKLPGLAASRSRLHCRISSIDATGIGGANGMDQELIAYLDARFRETSREFREVKEMVGQLAGTVEQLDARVGRLDGRVEQLDTRVERLDARGEQLDGKVGQLEGTVHQTQIMLESMRDDLRQVAEGVIANDQKLDAFKGEVAAQFEDMRALLRPAYGDLNRRVSALESWRERTERDPLEIIRERPGQPES